MNASHLISALVLTTVAMAAPSPAHAAPTPLGHACSDQSGVRFCPTASDAQRVPSFDGVPLDVDVTLPGTGDGPFPTLVMLHGLGSDKTSLENDGSFGSRFYARRGYAVVTYTARGFGHSCGPPTATTAGCDKGWTHTADQRYEERDTQFLLGMLVDEGIARRGALGVAGISYGGGQAQSLARLRDRVRLPDGQLVPWTSPNGTPLSLGAVFARWGWSDLTDAFLSNGRFLDFGAAPSFSQSSKPLGVMRESYFNVLYGVTTALAQVAPSGADPSADLRAWSQVLNGGEPYGMNTTALAHEWTTFHSASGVPGTPAPLLIQQGWTDDLLPATQALRVYRAFEHVAGANVSLQLGDLGHPRGANKLNQDLLFNEQGARFLDAYLRGVASPPAHRSVTAFRQTCPSTFTVDSGGPYQAATWERLHPGVVRFGAKTKQTVTSGGGDPAVGKVFDQPAANGACGSVAAKRSKGTAIYQRRTTTPYTLLGLPTVRARIATIGRYGELAARLWDVFKGRQRLVTRGVYRLTDNQRGPLVFQLFGNGWLFKRGHVAKLELLGSDPHFLRPSNGKFSVNVSKLTLALPTHEARRFPRAAAR